MSAEASSTGSHVVIYTDGGADPNPGPGGWGAVLRHEASDQVKTLSGGAPETTNNRMELTAAIEALTVLMEPCAVDLYTDSQYLKKGVTLWMEGWARRGWRRKDGQPVANVDLWKRLDEAIRRHRVSWHWVKGHAGDRDNERADQLATEARRRLVGQRPAPQSAAAPERKLPPADAEVFLKVACAKGTGGWAALLRRPKVEGLEEGMVVQGPRAEGVTSNRLDILAATQILEGFEQGETVAFYTGSEYLRKGAAQWLDGWRRKGWKTSTGKPVSNAEEWQSLDAAQRRLKVRWPELPERKLPRSKDLEGAAKASRMGESWEPKED